MSCALVQRPQVLQVQAGGSGTGTGDLYPWEVDDLTRGRVSLERRSWGTPTFGDWARVEGPSREAEKAWCVLVRSQEEQVFGGVRGAC